MKLPENLDRKFESYRQSDLFRKLPVFNNLVDFSSNDYIGFSKSETIFKHTHAFLLEDEIFQNGSTGSRLITGNHSLYQIAESFIAQFHEVEAALIFTSGYNANLGFFSNVPQENDVVLYDELCHASIKDGIAMSRAKSCHFIHNDVEDLEQLILKYPDTTIYIIIETVFSMDGDSPNLEEFVQLSEKYRCYLIADEAHALGVFGDKGEGLTQQLQVHNKFFARIVTFGKGLGCQGAAILGSVDLREYLINFARSFIYTTALSPHAVATIFMAYQQLEIEREPIKKLRQNIVFFNQQKNLLGLKPMFVHSKSSIHSAIVPGNKNVKRLLEQLQDKGFDVQSILSPIVPGNKNVKELSEQLQEKGFDVQPILSPIVSEGQERLRFCMHSYNSHEEITQILELVRDFVF